MSLIPVLAAAALAALVVRPAEARTSYYWDLNGNAAGSGVTSGSNGIWDNAVTANWSPTSDGTADSFTFVNNYTNHDAYFSAGTDATVPYTVTVDGIVQVTGTQIQEGTLTFAGTAGSSLGMSGGFELLATAGPLTFDSSLEEIYIFSSNTWTNGGSELFTVNAPINIRSHKGLTFNAIGSGDMVFNAVISAGGPGATYPGVTVNNIDTATGDPGTGRVILNATNTYLGDTNIVHGTLLANAAGATSNTLVTVSDGGRLGGHGSVVGAVIVNSGGTLLAGDGSIGTTLTLDNDLTLNDGSIIQLVLSSGGAHSTLTRTGAGDWVFAADQQFTANNPGGIDVGDTFDNIITGLAFDPGTTGWTLSGGGLSGNFTFDGANVDLTISTVPEPTSAAFLGIGAVGLLARRRRSRRRA